LKPEFFKDIMGFIIELLIETFKKTGVMGVV